MEKLVLPSLSTEDARLLSSCHILESLVPSLSDNEAIANYLRLEDLSISLSDFPKYSSDLKAKVDDLIKINPQAREIYLRLKDNKSIHSQVDDLISYGPKKLRPLFSQSLVDTYNAVMNTGFSLDNEDIHVDRVYVDGGKDHVGINLKHCTTNFALFKGIFGRPILNTDCYLGYPIKYLSFPNGLFNKYWKSFLEGYNFVDIHIKSVINLEEEIRLFLTDKKRSIKETLGEK